MHAILVMTAEGRISALAAGEPTKIPGLAEGLMAGSRIVLIHLERNTRGMVPLPLLTSPIRTVKAQI